VRIGIANQRILMRRIELPPLKDQAEIQQAVQFQAQDEIPMPLDTVVLDYHTLGIVEREGGPRLQVLLVAARRDMVERVLQAARLAGLQPEGVDLAAFGMIRALHPLDAGQDERVLYLAVGGLTNLAISRGLICEFTRVIPAGVEQIAADVASRCAIDIDEARRLLATPAPVDPPAAAAGASHAPSEIAASHDAAASAINPAAIVRTAIDEGVRRIGSEVRNSIDFYLTAQDAQAVGRAVLTGTALEIPGFIEALSGAIGITIDRGEVAAAPGASVPASLLPVAAGLSLSEGRQ
jgi:type IV pilus assembly protein PilM